MGRAGKIPRPLYDSLDPHHYVKAHLANSDSQFLNHLRHIFRSFLFSISLLGGGYLRQELLESKIEMHDSFVRSQHMAYRLPVIGLTKHTRETRDEERDAANGQMANPTLMIKDFEAFPTHKDAFTS